MTEIISFDEAIEDSKQHSKRHLILGNGFSIACCPYIFQYSSLYDRADFSSAPELENVFQAFNTHDFELILKVLNSGKYLFPIYSPDSEVLVKKIESHIGKLKELLLTTISENHPKVPFEIYAKSYFCKKFLNHFLGEGQEGQVYTLNYDLLLYWVLMAGDDFFEENPVKLANGDGFGNVDGEFEAPYVVWQGNSKTFGQRVHYLHGALHLFDAGYQLRKRTWNRSGISIIDQLKDALEQDEFPLFVAEGTSEEKMTKIEHHRYLGHCYKSLLANFEQLKPCFFIFGHALAENDDHILFQLGKGKFPKLYISLYGNPTTEINKQIISRAEHLQSLRSSKHPLDIYFYDACSANVWGQNHA